MHVFLDSLSLLYSGGYFRGFGSMAFASVPSECLRFPILTIGVRLCRKSVRTGPACVLAQYKETTPHGQRTARTTIRRPRPGEVAPHFSSFLAPGVCLCVNSDYTSIAAQPTCPTTTTHVAQRVNKVDLFYLFKLVLGFLSLARTKPLPSFQIKICFTFLINSYNN
jgi:hypothetical protein